MSNVALRRAWFQVHKWIGLILAVLIIPLSLSGSALVWDQALDRALNPGLYAASGSATIDPAAYAAAARGAVRDAPIISLTMPQGTGPVMVQLAGASVKRPGPPARTTVYLDPPDARVLGISQGNGLLRVFQQLHGSLLVPVWGRTIVGWLGVAMMVSCFTGLWLWWPMVGKWVKGLRWRRHRNLDTNLHHLFGFWVALPLFVLSLTGAWIAFPGVFGVFDGGAPQRGPARARPLAAPHSDIDTVIASAQAAVPGDVARIDWPTDRAPDWQVAFVDGREVRVADTTGATRAVPPQRETWARLMRRVHDGDGMSFVWQLIVFLGGLIPAALAITGVVMWWRARGWRADLAVRKAKA